MEKENAREASQGAAIALDKATGAGSRPSPEGSASTTQEKAWPESSPPCSTAPAFMDLLEVLYLHFVRLAIVGTSSCM